MIRCKCRSLPSVTRKVMHCCLPQARPGSSCWRIVYCRCLAWMTDQPAHHPQGRRLTGQCATACAHPVCCRIPGLTHDSLSRLACGCPSPRAASPTIGKAEAYPSSIAVSCCAWALHFGGDPRLQLSALCFMQECETRPCRAVADAKIFPHYRTSTISSPSWLFQERHRDVPGWDPHRSPRADSFIAQDAMPALPIELALVSFV